MKYSTRTVALSLLVIRLEHQDAAILVTLLHDLQQNKDAKLGLATLCIGGGMGCATIVEKY